MTAVEEDQQRGQQQQMKTHLCLQSQQLDAQVHHTSIVLAFIRQLLSYQRRLDTEDMHVVVGRQTKQLQPCGCRVANCKLF